MSDAGLGLCKSCDAWIKKTNTAPVFGGKSALNRMLGGNIGDLVVVRQYLEQKS